MPTTTGDDVGCSVANDGVGKDVAGAIDGGEPRQRQIFDVGGKSICDAGLNSIRSLVKQLGDEVAELIDDISVVAVATLHDIGAEAAGNDGEYQIMPTMRASHMMTKDLVFDFEAGKKWIMRDTVHGRQNDDELLILSGVCYAFQSEK